MVNSLYPLLYLPSCALNGILPGLWAQEPSVLSEPSLEPSQPVYPASIAKVFSRILKPSMADIASPLSPNPNLEAFFWELPHSGSSYPSCGAFSGKIISCPNDLHHYIRYRKFSCHRPDCPVCYVDWVKRAAKSATERLSNANILYHKSGKNLGPIKHIILSPPQDQALNLIQTKEGSLKLRKFAHKILQAHGFLGGCIILHPFRTLIRFNGKWINEETANTYQRKAIKNLQDPPIKWVWGPHFHILGWGHLTKSDDFYDQTDGWVYKNLGPRKSVFATISYLLTHAGLAYSLSLKSPLEDRIGQEVCLNHHQIILDNHQSCLDDHPSLTKRLMFHTIRWLGIVSYSKICIDYTEKIEEYTECPICHDLLCVYRSDIILELDCSDPAFPVVPPPEWLLIGPYIRKTTKKHFILSVDKRTRD